MVSFVRAMVHLISWFLILFFFFKNIYMQEGSSIASKRGEFGDYVPLEHI